MKPEKLMDKIIVYFCVVIKLINISKNQCNISFIIREYVKYYYFINIVNLEPIRIMYNKLFNFFNIAFLQDTLHQAL